MFILYQHVKKTYEFCYIEKHAKYVSFEIKMINQFMLLPKSMNKLKNSF